MSGIPFIQDTSTQLSGSIFTSGIPSYDNLNEWTKINSSNIYNTSLANVGIGTTTTTTYKLNVNGSLNSTSLYLNGTLIDFSSYATNTNLTNNYYNKSSTDSLLNSKQNTLTFSSPLINNTNTISIDLSSYLTTSSATSIYLTIANATSTYQPKISSYIISGGTGGTLIFNSGTLTLTMPNNYTSSMSISNLISPTSIIYKGAEISSTYLTIANATSTYQPNISTFTISGATGGTLAFATGTLALTMPNNYTSSMSISNLVSPTSILYKGAEISSTYLTIANATSTYLTIANAKSTYLTQANATSTYLTQANATSTYLTQANATSTYQPKISSYTISGATGGTLAFATGTLTLTMPNNYTTSMSISNLVSPTSIIYKGAEISSTYLTIANATSTYLTIANATSTYLPLTGGTITGNIIINATNSAFFFGGGGGASVSQASGVGAFSSSAAIGDCIVRSQPSNQLILQSGSGAGGIIINSANNTNINGVLTVLKNNWILSSDGILRIYFGDNGTSYFHSGNTGTGGFNFRNFAQSDIFTINENGNVSATGNITTNGIVVSNSGISTFKSIYITNPNNSQTHFPFTNGENYIRGKVNIDGDDLYVGGLTTLYNVLTLNNSIKFKTDVWNSSSDTKQRLYFTTNSTSIYQGYGNFNYAITHEFRDNSGAPTLIIYNVGDVKILGQLSIQLYSVNYTGYDDVGVLDVSGSGQSNQRDLVQIYNSFTAFHRCFTDDELFDIDNPQEFKDNYMGRIVVSTGTIKTDTSISKGQWEVKTGKNAIVVEDAHPTIELSRKKKDKKVFGVLGLNTRNNSRPERLIVNSIGEGGVLVINSNGNFENGDLITTSNYLGYGEFQNDDIIHNYTLGKITMACLFELNNPNYECFEIDDLDENGNKLRVVFVACVYYCG